MTASASILPADPVKAVRHVIGIVEQLLRLLEKEGMALATKDAVSFAATQTEKAALADAYAQASREFKARILDFRGVDRALLDRLDTLQRELNARSKESTAAMERFGS